MKVKGVRGLSAVVATVLLLSITIAAAALIAPFVINFVKDNLNEGEMCFDILGDLSFEESPYNCKYDDGIGNLRTGFSVRIENEKILGFKVSLASGGSSDIFEINDGQILNNIKMLGGAFNEPLEFPSKGGVRTYVADNLYDNIEIFPILENGKLCGASDSIEINECFDSDIKTALI